MTSSLSLYILAYITFLYHLHWQTVEKEEMCQQSMHNLKNMFQYVNNGTDKHVRITFVKALLPSFPPRLKLTLWIFLIPRDRGLYLLRIEQMHNNQMYDWLLQLCWNTNSLIMQNVNECLIVKIRISIHISQLTCQYLQAEACYLAWQPLVYDSDNCRSGQWVTWELHDLL